MSRPISPKPARPFANFFYTNDAKLDSALEKLDNRLGNRCFTSQALVFDRTDYYVKEMGEGIRRIFAAWEKLIDPSQLIALKKEAWKIEDDLRGRAEGRPVNIDPGLIEEGRLTLATGKPAAHRPYLGEGVYVDLTLIYERKSYRPLPWTYPDYCESETIEMLNELRAQYMKDVKKEKYGGQG